MFKDLFLSFKEHSIQSSCVDIQQAKKTEKGGSFLPIIRENQEKISRLLKMCQLNRVPGLYCNIVFSRYSYSHKAIFTFLNVIFT